MADISKRDKSEHSQLQIEPGDDLHEVYKEMIVLYISQVRFLLELRILRKEPRDLDLYDFSGKPLADIRMMQMWTCPTYTVCPSRLSEWKENLRATSTKLVRSVSMVNLGDNETCLCIAKFLQRLIHMGLGKDEESNAQVLRSVAEYKERIPHLQRAKEIHKYIIQLFQCRDAAGPARKIAIVEHIRFDLYKAARLCVYHFGENEEVGIPNYEVVNIGLVRSALLRFPMPRLQSKEIRKILDDLRPHIYTCKNPCYLMKDVTIVRSGILRRPISPNDGRVLDYVDRKTKIQCVVEVAFNGIIEKDHLPQHAKYTFIKMTRTAPFPTVAKLVKTVKLVEGLNRADGIVYIAYHQDVTVAVAMLSACLTYARGDRTSLACIRAEGIHDFHPFVDAIAFRNHMAQFYPRYCAIEKEERSDSQKRQSSEINVTEQTTEKNM